MAILKKIKKFFLLILLVSLLFFNAKLYAEEKYVPEPDMDILATDDVDIFSNFKRVAEKDLDLLFDDIEEVEDFQKEETKPSFLSEELNALEDEDNVE